MDTGVKLARDLHQDPAKKEQFSLDCLADLKKPRLFDDGKQPVSFALGKHTRFDLQDALLVGFVA